MAKGGKGGGQAANDTAFQAQMDEQERQNRIRQGTTSINTQFDNQFNDDFYTGRRQSFLDYANPQLADQFADTRKKLTYWLDSRGLLDSSVRADKEAELQKLYDQNQRQVTDQGLNYENDAKNKVADARAGLIRDLQASGDNQGAVQAATNRATALSAPDTYSPLADMFSSFTGALGTQAALERSAAFGGPEPAFNTGLFAPNRKAVVNQ